jgi:hypothetical protein
MKRSRSAAQTAFVDRGSTEGGTEAVRGGAALAGTQDTTAIDAHAAATAPRDLGCIEDGCPVE